MRNKFFISFLAALIIFGCGENNNDTLLSPNITQQYNVINENNNEIQYILKNGVVELNNISLNNIKQYKSGEIIFKKGDEIIDNIKVGNIIICGTSEKTPIGFIEKIINIEYNNTDIVFTTQSAVLEDAFEFLEIHKEINSEIIYT